MKLENLPREVPFRERKEVLKGRSGEHLIAAAAALQTKGWYVIPSYDYIGEKQDKAPKLKGQDEELGGRFCVHGHKGRGSQESTVEASAGQE